MELEVLVTATTELAENQKATGEQIDDLAKQIKQIGEKVNTFSDKLTNIQVVAPAPDTRLMSTKLAEFLQKVTSILEAQPKNVVHQYRFLLFPADHADHYYRIIFGRLLGWAVLILVCTYLFSLGQRYIETSNRRYNFEVYQNAWHKLDSTLGPSNRKKMQEALQEAVNEQ